jgi:putative glutamine amidotransferase
VQIAITQRVTHNPSYKDDRDALSHDWVLFLEATVPGCVVVPVPNNIRNVKAWLDAINPDVVILSNGNDLGAEKIRDECERGVMHWAIEKGKPLLGVCRGLQFVNCYFGGGLTTDLNKEVSMNHVAKPHTVSVIHPVFSRLLNDKSAAGRVNSYHNQGVQADELASGLTAFATTADGTIEGLVHDSKPIMAVQWHPERDGNDHSFGPILVRKFMQEGRFW